MVQAGRRCLCGCCLTEYTSLGSWYPQRWSIDLGSWSWSIPTGITQHDENGPLSPAVETQIDSQEFHAQTIAHPLSGLGVITAWAFRADKYGAAFGTCPVTTPYGGVASAGAPVSFPSTPEKWVGADDTSVAQWWHDAYAIAQYTAPYTKVSIPATLHSEIVPMIDESDNSSGALPWRNYDAATIATLGASYSGAFVSPDHRIAAGYPSPYVPNVDWLSGASLVGNTVTVQPLMGGDGRCRWYVTLYIRPKFSVWSNGLLTRPEYYRTGSTPVPPDLYANGYINNGGVPPGEQNTYPGRFGYVHPAILPYTSHKFDTKGWSIPPYLIADHTGAGTGAFEFDDTIYLANQAGPGNDSLDTSDPPGGWRSFIALSWASGPIRCQRDLEDGDEITLSLDESYDSEEFRDMLDAGFGLNAPPATITMQRLADIT
jgi:hypothetical protein